MADTPLTIIGAGVVGLAVAARLAPRYPGTLILERADRHGTGTSSRNSEVIHAGIYYEPGSLKAQLCVEGKELTYELCRRHGVTHRRIEKVLVATTREELETLDSIRARAAHNGVALAPLSAEQVSKLEPAVSSHGGLLSPSTGIVSAHELMDCYLRLAQDSDATLVRRAFVTGIEPGSDGYRIEVTQEGEAQSLTSERVVNAAGLFADEIAALAGIDLDRAGYRQHWARGCYFAAPSRLNGIVKRLIYPVPGSASLGIHTVSDVGGRLRFGPDVDFLADRREDYSVPDEKADRFLKAVASFLPAVRGTELTPDFSGIRAKLQAPGTPRRDFVVAEESGRGLPGFVNLLGIESPGLTAAPAIAHRVEALLAG